MNFESKLVYSEIPGSFEHLISSDIQVQNTAYPSRH